MFYIDFIDSTGLFSSPYTTDIVCNSFEVEKLSNGTVQLRVFIKLNPESRGITHTFTILPQRLIVRPAKLS